ncbi:hypothetical protein N8004_00815 [Salibacteraceae bacterium]|nr:hypothetical protein [Flavobacteriales bacterium]MDB9701836.1 hypothetical protein [Salibacteraceae bacterium]MDC1202498.1 hypothetical protein [Salibacteraceae bacterium]HAW20980.1 hypothetical protein [Flavobacteriales bacterium]
MKGLFTLAIIALSASFSFAQCDITADVCQKHITDDFLSDGQHYRALLLTDQVAEFNATLYGGTTYRISACSGTQDGNLLFRVTDKDRNLIFRNVEHKNAPYWDFQLESTMDVIIEAELDPIAGNSGCAVMLIGFKR